MFEGSRQEFTVADGEIRAFLHVIAPHIVALLPPDGLHVGSGTLIKWKSSHLILTANHNLNGTKASDIRFVFYPGGTLRDGPMDAASDRTFLSRGLLMPVEDDIFTDEQHDIAAIPLKVKDLPSAARPYELSPRQPILGDGNTIILAGFAWDNSFPLQGEARAVGITTQTGTFDSSLNSKQGLSSNYDPEYHFLLPYTRVTEGVRPYGISGTGAWCNAGRTGTIWAPSPVLAGVQTSWFSTSKILQIVRLGPIVSLLTRLCG